MTGSAIAGRITPGSAGAQLEACSRERWASAEGTDKNMCRIGGWYALFSAVISQYNSFRVNAAGIGLRRGSLCKGHAKPRGLVIAKSYQDAANTR